jgi:maltose phosphorylase
MEGYSFKINFRNQIVTVSVSQENTTFSVDGTRIVLNGTATTVNPSAVLA